MRENLTKPEFHKAGHVHDWRNYVLDEYKEKWHKLSYEVKLAIYDHCDNAASKEEWD